MILRRIYLVLVSAIYVAAYSDSLGISIEHASIRSYPEADTTKVAIFIKNAGSRSVAVRGVNVDRAFLNLRSLVVTNVAQTLAGDFLDTDHHRTDIGGDGVQWVSCLPNPIPANATAKVTISLWGTTRETDVCVLIDGDVELPVHIVETPVILRLTHIAFSWPARKAYIYVENTSKQDVHVDHLLVNGLLFTNLSSVPDGGCVQPQGKTCFIVDVPTDVVWGDYVTIGVVDQEGRKVLECVRVWGVFPIGSWDGDTRANMFFDSEDIFKQVDLSATSSAIRRWGWTGRRSDHDLYKAFYGGEDPTCDPHPWEENAATIIHTMRRLKETCPYLPYYTHICWTTREAYAFFGDLTDFVCVNPYNILHRPMGPSTSGRNIELARTWVDPRSVVSVPEAFSEQGKRDLSPDEVAFAMWCEVMAGAKGVRYFTRSFLKGCGYKDMPGVESVIRYENLRLQLLKFFLQIGDTYNCATTTNDNIVCKTVLCGDQGIVLLLLNKAFTWSVRVQTSWRTVGAPAEILLDIPAGMHVAEVFEAEYGFRPTRFSSSDRSLRLNVPDIGIFKVYFIAFDKTAQQCVTDRDHRVLPALQSVLPGRSDLSPDEIWRVHESFVAEVMAPMLDPRRHQLLDAPTVVSAATKVQVAREWTLRQLAAVEVHLEEYPHEDVASVVSSASKAYMAMGAYDRAESIYSRIATNDSFSGITRSRVCVSLAEAWRQFGRCSTAEYLYIQALDRAPETDRFSILANLIDLCSSRHDFSGAARWAAVRATLATTESYEKNVAAKLRLAVLLIRSGHPEKAVGVLAPTGSTQDSDLVEYLLGVAYAGIDAQKAKHHLEGVIGRDGVYAKDARYWLVIVLLCTQEYTEAQNQLRKVLSLSGDSEYTRIGRRISRIFARCNSGAAQGP